MKNVLKYIGIAFIAVGLFSCGDDDTTPTVPPVVQPTIAEIVTVTPEYSSLLAALQKAGLAETLNGEGNFTVFAPDNDAFGRLLTALGVTLEEVPDETLRQILLNHVIGAEAFAADLSTTYLETLATYGDTDAAINMYVNVSADGVKLNGMVDVTTPDLADASNGVIHAVSDVITLPTVVTFATADPTFETLVAALTREDLATDFVGTLSNAEGMYTVFAPTNDAFGALLDEFSMTPGFEMITSLAEIPVGTLDATLKMHAIAGANVRSNALPDSATTLGGDISIDPTTAIITDANGRESTVVVADVQAANGVVHVIDKVILPQLAQ